ncbi:MAG: hypothetical protein AAF211_22080, partial [Myxococcota bacterium]
FADRITTVRGDLRDPPEGPYDLVWAEGSAYFLGFEAAMTQWPALLNKGGGIALTDLVRLQDPMPPDAEALWSAEYPDLSTLAKRRAQVAKAGLVLHDCFVLDADAAWRPYLDPLQARIDALRPSADGPLTAVLDTSQHEIDTLWAHRDAANYAFFVVGRPDEEAEA